jgi:2-polyprenyl-3-methyl-5-hydroxy-6-metoxy-1,4-benzoquinol methylase
MIVIVPILSAVCIAFFLFIVFVLISSSITNAPYLPSDDASVKSMIAMARITPGIKTVDLGSGDGRVVVAMARAGAEAHGYEINPFLIWISRWRIKRAGLSGKAFIHSKSFWNADVGCFQVVTIFTLPYFIPRIEKKLQRELKPGARCVLNGAVFSHWLRAQKDAEHGIFLYIKS